MILLQRSKCKIAENSEVNNIGWRIGDAIKKNFKPQGAQFMSSEDISISKLDVFFYSKSFPIF